METVPVARWAWLMGQKRKKWEKCGIFEKNLLPLWSLNKKLNHNKSHHYPR